MRVFAALSGLSLVVALSFSALVAGCWGSNAARTPSPEETLSAHRKACSAGGTVIVMTGEMSRQACAVTVDQLRSFVSTDPDCVAYFGDAGAAITADKLCEGSDDGS